MKVNLNNDCARRDWLEQYHAWGVWFRVEQTGAAVVAAQLPEYAVHPRITTMEKLREEVAV